MRDFHLGPEVRPEPLRFAGPANVGSFSGSAAKSPFSDAEETELGFELLHVKSDAALEQFLSNLFKKAWRGIQPVASEIAKPLSGLFKAVAQRALPSVAAAVDTFPGRPAGGAIAGKLGSLVRQAPEADVAGMAAADRALEKRRHFVRLAGKILPESAKEKLRRKAVSAARVGKFAEARAAAAMKPGAAASRAAQISRTRTEVPGRCVCSVCALPLVACECRKIGRSGRWVRGGSSILVNGVDG